MKSIVISDALLTRRFMQSEYYTNTGLQSSAIFSTSDGQKDYDYIEPSPTPVMS
jgi:hypothetical protein